MGTTSSSSSSSLGSNEDQMEIADKEAKIGDKDWGWHTGEIDHAEIKSVEELLSLRGSPEGKTESCTTVEEMFEEEDKRIASTLLEEMKRNGYHTELPRAIACAMTAKEGRGVYIHEDMREEYLVALSLYTSNRCYSIVNQALRATAENLDVIKFCSNFVKGLRMLPSYWSKVYRGVLLPKNELEEYQPGKIILLKGFTSTSKESMIALALFHARLKLEKKTELLGSDTAKCFFEIESRSGRSLEEVSFYPDEKEVVFRSFTSFHVISRNLVDSVYYIRLLEAYPDIRGRKVLVWIDDQHALESKLIMDGSERFGVTCVHLHSTLQAKQFFENFPFLLMRDADKLRIITDMVRVEEDNKQNLEAGLEVTRLLATLKYTKPMMCFTSPKYCLLNREKFIHHKWPHVFTTDKRSEAELFAKFVPLPPSSSSSSSSSTSSSFQKKKKDK